MATASLPIVPTATHPANRGNLRLKSLTLRELDTTSALSLAVDLTVEEQRLKFVSNFDSGANTPMFSALGSTLEVDTLSVASIIGTNLELGDGRLDVVELSVQGVSSELSVAGNAYMPLLSAQVAHIGTLNIFGANTLSVGGRAVFDGGDVAFSGADGKFEIARQVSVGSHATINGRLSVGGDAILSGYLSVAENITAETYFSVGGFATMQGPYVEMKGDLSVGGTDTTLDTNLSVSGELVVRDSAVFDSSLSTNGDLTTAAKLSVGNSVRLSNILNVVGASTFHNKVSVHGPLDVLGTVSIGGDVTTDASLSVSSLATLGTLSAGSTTVHEMKVRNNLSVHGDLIVEGTTITLNTSQVDIEDPIIEIGTGGEALAGIKIVKDTVATNNQSGFFREKASDDGTTPAYFAVYEEFNDSDSNNIVKTVGDLRAGMLSTSSSAFLGGPLSVGGQLYVEGAGVLEGSLSLQGFTHMEGDLSVGGNGNLDGNFEMQGALSIGGEVTATGRLSVHAGADVGGVMQVNDALSVTGSVTMAADLSVGTDLQVDAMARISDTLSVGSFTVISDSLSTGAEVVVDGFLSVSGAATIAQSLSVSDVAVLSRSEGTNLFTIAPASLGLVQLTADNVDVVHQMEFDEMPLSVTVHQDSKTDIVYNDVGTATGPAIVYNQVTGKYVLNLQYVDGTATPALVPSTITVVTTRPYVPKSAFRIKNVLTDLYIHDVLDVVPKDLFTADSGQIVPTISVSGDVVVGSALSVGHDVHCAGNTLFSNALKRVGILGRLSVANDLNVNQRVIIGGEADAFLSVGSDIAASETLSVGGQVILGSEVSVGADAYFEQDVSINQNLSVNASLDVAADGRIAGSLSVTGLTVIDDDLSVAANQVVGVDLSVGSVLTSFYLSVQKTDANELSVGSVFVEADLINSGTTDLYGASQMGATLSVAANTFLRAQLSVGGNTQIDSGVFIGDVLSVASSTQLEGAVFVNNTLDVAAITRINNSLSVQGNVTNRGSLSVGGLTEITGDTSIRGLATVNNRLSVGRAGTIARQLSVGDTITGSRDLSIGGLVLDRERTHNRYYLVNNATNNGLEIVTTSAGLPFIFSLADGRLVTVSSFQDGPDFVVRSPNVSVEWIEVPANVTNANMSSVTDLMDSGLTYTIDVSSSGATAPVLAGLTALSVGHNAIFGKEGEDTFLSIGSTMDVTGRSQIGNTLSVSGDATLAAALSVGGQMDVADHTRVLGSISVNGLGIIGSTLSVHADTTIRGAVSMAGELDVMNDTRIASSLSVNQDLDVKTNARIHGSLSVQGLTTIDDHLSVAQNLEVGEQAAIGSHLSIGASVTAGSYLSIQSFAAIGDYAEIKDRLSVGGELALVGKAEMDSTLSVTGFAFLGNSLEVAANISTGGDMQHAGLISVGGFVSMDGSLSVGDIVVMDKSLSVASMVATPELGDNHFVFNQPITQDLNAITLRIELSYPHTLSLDTNTGDVGLTPATITTNGTYISSLTNASGLTTGIGQINGFKLFAADNPNNAQLRYMTEHEVVNVEYELGDGSATVVHNNISTPGLTGGKRAPTLSVGGRIIVLEDLSVGFDTTIQGGLSVSGAIQGSSLSLSSIITTTISTQTLFVANSGSDVIEALKMSVGSAFIDHGFVKDSLSVAGPVRFENDDIIFTGQNLTLEQNLSVGGDAQMNLISVANLHANMLSVNETIASELSVHTLFVQQVTTSDPDESFDFQDDAYFQGDLSIEGKLFVKDIIYTGPGGAFTIENVAGLTVSGNISTASLFLDITNPPTSSNDNGTAGIFTVDQQYLYVCIADNTWRRVTMSAF